MAEQWDINKSEKGFTFCVTNEQFGKFNIHLIKVHLIQMSPIYCHTTLKAQHFLDTFSLAGLERKLIYILMCSQYLATPKITDKTPYEIPNLTSHHYGKTTGEISCILSTVLLLSTGHHKALRRYKTTYYALSKEHITL